MIKISSIKNLDPGRCRWFYNPYESDYPLKGTILEICHNQYANKRDQFPHLKEPLRKMICIMIARPLFPFLLCGAEKARPTKQKRKKAVWLREIRCNYTYTFVLTLNLVPQGGYSLCDRKGWGLSEGKLVTCYIHN